MTVYIHPLLSTHSNLAVNALAINILNHVQVLYPKGITTAYHRTGIM